MSQGELRWLKDDEVKSNAVAKSEIARGAGGKTRYLYELATGSVPTAEVLTSQACTPRNPQGKIGVDHSGPPWGVAFKHPVLTGPVIDPTDGSEMSSPRGHIVIASGSGVTLARSVVMRSRPFALQSLHVAPYQRIPFWMLASGAASGTLVATVHYRVGSNINAVTRGSSAVVTSSTEQVWQMLASGLPDGIDLPPSGQSEFFVNLEWIGSGPITIKAFGAWQTAHLRHD